MAVVSGVSECTDASQLSAECHWSCAGSGSRHVYTEVHIYMASLTSPMMSPLAADAAEDVVQTSLT